MMFKQFTEESWNKFKLAIVTKLKDLNTKLTNLSSDWNASKAKLLPSYTNYNGDLNDLTEYGVYEVYNYKNTPNNSTGHFVVVVFLMNHNKNFAMQVAFSEQKIYYRGSNTGKWNNWITVV